MNATEKLLEENAGIANLSTLARALGFDGVTVEFVAAMRGKVGAFTRLAALNGVDLSVAVAAKREFIAEFVS